jgi:hypothetical protein
VKEVFGNLDGKHEELRRTVAKQGDELVESDRRNSELNHSVQQLEDVFGAANVNYQGLWRTVACHSDDLAETR